MALVIETGSGLVNANCYGVTDGPTTLTACRSYAADRGIVLSPTDSVLSAQLVLGTDYLESFAARYVGVPTSYTQALSWPRMQVQFDPSTPFPSNALPVQLLEALYQLAIEQFNGINLQPSVDHTQGGFITKEKVDVIETTYSERIGTVSSPLLPKVESLLSSILNAGIALRTVRI